MRDVLTEIWESIRRNKLRTALTGFAVSWGIFMLIVLLGAGNGLMNAFMTGSEGLATNVMQVGGGRTSKPYDGLKEGRRIWLDERDVALTGSEVFANHVDQVISSVSTSATVSYGRHFTAKRETEVTTVGIGYADGLSRLLSNGFELVVDGEKCPIIGNVCMDMCMVDTTDMKVRPKVGDKVVVFGRDRSADDLAERMGTINYEITCDVGKRVRRIYTGGDSK